MKLSPLPQVPEGVKYALTVPQSVLFADLSLQGNLRGAFTTAMHIDYEPEYIVIDNGAMSWNYDHDDRFVAALLAGRSPALGIARFIQTMESTSQSLSRISTMLAPSEMRRSGIVQDLIEDLHEYWLAYTLHMTSLFTFWNVEYILSTTLTRALQETGHTEDLRQGLVRFLQPYEANYFVLEREQLAKIAKRLVSDNQSLQQAKVTIDVAPPVLINALQCHSRQFGFLLAPFNLGAPPSVESLLDRLSETSLDVRAELITSSLKFGGASLDDLPPDVQELGVLAQRFTFWKTERLDVASLCDARVQSLYDATCSFLSLSPEHLFAMTSQEIIDSLQQGSVVVPEEVRQARRDGYCLLLYKGQIGFYESATSIKDIPVGAAAGSMVRGVGASAGVVTGRARVILGMEGLGELEAGDILVTTMTRPEMGAALDRAAALRY